MQRLTWVPRWKVESEKLQEKAQRAKELADSFDLDAAAFDDPALEAAVKDIQRPAA